MIHFSGSCWLSNFGNSCVFLIILHECYHPANIYLFKGSNRKTRKRCEICSKLTIKTSELYHWGLSGVVIVNFEYISHFFLEFLLLTLNKQMLAGNGCKHYAITLAALYVYIPDWAMTGRNFKLVIVITLKLLNLQVFVVLESFSFRFTNLLK